MDVRKLATRILSNVINSVVRQTVNHMVKRVIQGSRKTTPLHNTHGSAAGKNHSSEPLNRRVVSTQTSEQTIVSNSSSSSKASQGSSQSAGSGRKGGMNSSRYKFDDISSAILINMKSKKRGGSMPSNEEIHENFIAFVKFLTVLYVVSEFGFDITMCVGPSMLPTFNLTGDIVICEHISPRLGLLRKGDVIVSQSPTDPKSTICKRIAAMEGDEVEFLSIPPSLRSDQRYSLAKYSSGSGTLIETKGTTMKMRIPANYVWLLGDNETNSTDSRNYGPVPISKITGRVVLKIWPPNEIKWVSREKPAKA